MNLNIKKESFSTKTIFEWEKCLDRFEAVMKKRSIPIWRMDFVKK